MSQQGERPAAADDWWGRLYDGTAEDRTTADKGDSLDDRFASAAGAVGGAPDADPGARSPEPPGPGAGPPAPEGPPDPAAGPPPWAGAPAAAPRAAAGPEERAPWEPPAEGVLPSRTFPFQRTGATTADTTPETAAPGTATPETAAPGTAAPGAAAPGTAAPGNAAPELPAPETTAVAGPAAHPPLPVRRPPGGAVAAPPGPAPESPPAGPPVPPARTAAAPRPAVTHVGDGPPTYDAEPTALPDARPDTLDELVADTVLDGASYGSYTVRAASVRGDSARYRGEPRRDALLTARFGSGDNALVLVAVAGGARTPGGAHLAAADACRWIGAAVGRSRLRLAEDIRAGRRGDLKSGLHRLTGRGFGRLRARAAELGLAPHEYTASLHCLLLSGDPDCRTRVFFGVGGGGLFRLRDGVWQDMEPELPGRPGSAGEDGAGPGRALPGDRPATDPGTAPPLPAGDGAPHPPPTGPFRFRASVARPGDTLLLCSAGLAEPLRGEPALSDELAARWAPAEPPGLAEFLADTQVRVKGYADDRTAAAVWEA